MTNLILNRLQGLALKYNLKLVIKFPDEFYSNYINISIGDKSYLIESFTDESLFNACVSIETDLKGSIYENDGN